VGSGIKTFLNTAKNQKIAEFNNQRPLYSTLGGIELATKISELRNDRIAFTARLYGLEEMIYHCVVRSSQRIEIFEEPLIPIELSTIEIISETDKKIIFTDRNEIYEFYIAKSTLFKQFNMAHPIMSVAVVILENPMEQLRVLLESIEGKGYDPGCHYLRMRERKFDHSSLFNKAGETFHWRA
jgi:hypothetical protein